MALLRSFGRVGRFAGSTKVAGAASRAMGLLLTVAVSAFALQLLASERAIGGPILLALAVLVLGLAIGALLVYFGVLRELRESLAVAE